MTLMGKIVTVGDFTGTITGHTPEADDWRITRYWSSGPMKGSARDHRHVTTCELMTAIEHQGITDDPR